MNLTFEELKCPKCGEPLEQGSITAGSDVSMVKLCTPCSFWMIIVIPNNDYDYKIVREFKKQSIEHESSEIKT